MQNRKLCLANTDKEFKLLHYSLLHSTECLSIFSPNLSFQHLPWKHGDKDHIDCFIWRAPETHVHRTKRSALCLIQLRQKKRLFACSTDRQSSCLAKQAELVDATSVHRKKENPELFNNEQSIGILSARLNKLQLTLLLADLSFISIVTSEDLPRRHLFVLAWNQIKGLKNKIPRVNWRSMFLPTLSYTIHIT